MPFIPLHIHSNYSLCRGANAIEQICATAKSMGYSHLAITDTNGVYGLGWFLQEARDHGVIPLTGAFLQTKAEHAVVLAKDLQGYHHLCRIISQIQKDNGCSLAVELSKAEQVVIVSDDLPLLERLPDKDVYVELIAHGNREEALRFSRQSHRPVVASSASYFLKPEDYQTHRLLRAIDLNTSLTRIPADELASPQAWLRNAKEMQALFPDCPEAIENSEKIAQRCAFDLNFGKEIFPAFIGPDGQDAQTYLNEQVEIGLVWRYGTITPEIRKRRDYELSLITEKGFAPYFLVVADAVRKAPRTCGRGSAASSLVSYCLGITHVDPIKYDLFFERFLNPGRKDPPDIDVDFPWDERDDILDYLFKKYGSGHIAMIANHNCFKARSAMREIAKVYGLPETEINEITKRISSYLQPNELANMVRTHPVFKNVELREPWPEIMQKAEQIRGFPRHLSIHCGGVVIAPDGLNHYVPFQPAKKMLHLTGALEGGLPSDVAHLQVVQWEKDQSEDMGLIKMDILGNRSLAVIRDALAAVEKNYGKTIDYATWDALQDPDTQALIARGDTIGVFYVESPAMRHLQQKTGKGDFEHLVIHSSIIRPAANYFINEYVRRLRGGSYDPLHPRLEELLKETYGIMVYQEDVSKVAMALADFDSSSADDLRKIIAKKHKRKLLENYRERFFNGAMRNGVDQEICKKIWDMILSFSEYSFCKPHSASFAQVSFKSAWLKSHYPAEFIAAVISNQGGYYSTFAYISEARRMGLTVLLPDINNSERCYTGKDLFVQVGFMQIKGLSHQAKDNILAARQHLRVFTSLDHVLAETHLDPSDMTLLIKTGCFDRLEQNRTRPELLWRALAWYNRNRKKSAERMSLFDETEKMPAQLPQPPSYNEKDTLQHEVDALGFLLSRHPLTLYEQAIKQISFVRGCDLHRHIGETVQTIGWLITYKLISTKREELMEFLSFEDTTAIYEATFFPKVYNRFAHMMTTSRPYVLQGRVEEQYGAISVNVHEIKYL
jgi:error-prone DNA polymerase